MAFSPNRPLWQFSSLQLGTNSMSSVYFLLLCWKLSESFQKCCWRWSVVFFLSYLLIGAVGFQRGNITGKHLQWILTYKSYNRIMGLLHFTLDMFGKVFFFYVFLLYNFSKNAAPYFILICYSLFIVVFFSYDSQSYI